MAEPEPPPGYPIWPSHQRLKELEQHRLVQELSLSEALASLGEDGGLSITKAEESQGGRVRPAESEHRDRRSHAAASASLAVARAGRVIDPGVSSVN